MYPDDLNQFRSMNVMGGMGGIYPSQGYPSTQSQFIGGGTQLGDNPYQPSDLVPRIGIGSYQPPGQEQIDNSPSLADNAAPEMPENSGSQDAGERVQAQSNEQADPGHNIVQGLGGYDTTLGDLYKRILGEPPVRPEVGKGRKILGALASLQTAGPATYSHGAALGFNAGDPRQAEQARDQAMYGDFNRQNADYQERLRQLGAGASMERFGNINNRMAAYQAGSLNERSRSNDIRDAAQKSADEKWRASTEARYAGMDSKERINQANADMRNGWISKMEPDQDGYLHAFTRDGSEWNTGIQNNDIAKIEARGEQTRQNAASRPAASRPFLIPQIDPETGKPLSPKLVSPGGKEIPMDSSVGPNRAPRSPAMQGQDVWNKAQEWLRTHPKDKDLLTLDPQGKIVTVKPLSGYFSTKDSPENRARRDAINKYLNGESSGKVRVLNPAGKQFDIDPKDLDDAIKNGWKEVK